MIPAPSIDTWFSDLTEGGTVAAVDEQRVVEVVREYLAAVREHLADLHRRGGSGRHVNEVHSDLMDRLVRRLFSFAEESFFAGGGDSQTDLAILAVGGYARREMSVYSDVDLLFLHRNKVNPFVEKVTERLQYWMWDAQLQLGCATRNIAETISLAKTDQTVFTAILNPRLLAGSGQLFHEFGVQRRTQLFNDPERIIRELMASDRERHADYGGSLYLLEPNLKDGQGTLRDYHSAYWCMQATQPNARRVEEFRHLGLLTPEEVDELLAALDFLWCIRNEMHLRAGRKIDQMSFETQEKVAASFGFVDDGGELPIEMLMGHFYRHARAIQNYSSLVIEQCLARVRKVPRRRRPKDVEHGFRLANEQLEIPHGIHLRDDPRNLLRAFSVAQKRDVALTRKARRLIRENLSLIDDEFRSDPQAVAIFEQILCADHRVMRTLMDMNEEGLLGAFIPEWNHIVCRWQHIMYHTYTVDVHTIFLVEELRRLWKGEYVDFVPDLTDMVRNVDDRTVLFLGCLFHDIGKGMGGEHSMKGATLARRCVERMGLSEERIERVVFLVEYHLLMSHLAQNRDLTDPKLIVEFARTVSNRRNLKDLYLLTFADIRASSKVAWTDWKGQLLRELFERTSEFLETGNDDENRAIEQIEARVEVRQKAARSELVSHGMPDGVVRSYFEMMPRRYFISHAPAQIARHARVVVDFGPDEMVSTSVREMRGGFSELILCTKDFHGLFSRVAGVLTAHDINILGANAYTTRSGLALEIYRVETPPGGEGERRIMWDDFDRSLESVLRDEIDVPELIRNRGRRVRSKGNSPRLQPTRVRLTNDESDFYTIADVTTNDRIGLLHDLTQVIADRNIEIYISKAGTVLDQVQDTFYLKTPDGKKLAEAEQLESLREALASAAEGAGEPA